MISSVALILSIFLTIKFLIRIDTKTYVEKPQLLYQCESSRVGSKGDILIYYRIHRWPVVLESSISRDYFQEISVAQEKDLQKIMEVVSSDNYTYFVSYGAPIQQVEYSFEDGWDIFPYLPIDGREALPKIVFGDKTPNFVYIYRIPVVAIDNIG